MQAVRSRLCIKRLKSSRLPISSREKEGQPVLESAFRNLIELPKSDTGWSYWREIANNPIFKVHVYRAIKYTNNLYLIQRPSLK